MVAVTGDFETPVDNGAVQDETLYVRLPVLLLDVEEPEEDGV